MRLNSFFFPWVIIWCYRTRTENKLTPQCSHTLPVICLTSCCHYFSLTDWPFPVGHNRADSRCLPIFYFHLSLYDGSREDGQLVSKLEACRRVALPVNPPPRPRLLLSQLCVASTSAAAAAWCWLCACAFCVLCTGGGHAENTAFVCEGGWWLVLQANNFTVWSEPDVCVCVCACVGSTKRK